MFISSCFVYFAPKGNLNELSNNNTKKNNMLYYYFVDLPRYLAPKLRQWLLREDVISDIIRPGSTIREDHIDMPYRGTLCSSFIQFRELPEKKHFKQQSW